MKISESFEGENSSLRKAFDEAVKEDENILRRIENIDRFVI